MTITVEVEQTGPIEILVPTYEISVSTSGPPGPPGAPGSPGATGNATLESVWVYDPSSTSGPPASGSIRLNSTDLTTATQLYVHEIDRAGVDRSVEMDLLGAGSLVIRDANGDQVFYEVPTAGVDQGAWRITPLVYQSGPAAVTSPVWLTAVNETEQFVSQDRVIATSTGLTGGGDLTTDRTLAVDQAAVQMKVQKGTPSGYASLDATGKVPLAQLPPISSAPSRTVASFTTPSLAAGASATGTIDLGKGYRLYRITTSAACRTRLYTTDAKRTADASRPSGTDPTGDHGLMLDFTSTGSSGGWGSQQTGHPSATPTSFGVGGGQSYGVDYTFAVAGRIVGMRYGKHASSVPPQNMHIYSSSGVLLKSVTNSESGSGWKSSLFATPLAVTAGQTVRAVYDIENGTQYSGADSAPASDYVSGDITMDKDTWFKFSPFGYPNTAGSGVLPYVDVLFEKELAAVPGLLSADFSPMVDGFDGKATPDGLIPYAITNTGTGAAAITVTLTYIKEEG